MSSRLLLAQSCTTPVITSVVADKWNAGSTYNITITGTNFVPVAYIYDNNIDCMVTPLSVVAPTGSVTVSNVVVASTTQITATVTPAATDPPETVCVEVFINVVIASKGRTGISVAKPESIGLTPSCTDSSGNTGYPAYIVGDGPAISSVSPDGWWAGQTRSIAINGSGFLTASDTGGPSQVTVTDGANAVTLTNPVVTGPNQITATVNVNKKAKAETVTLTVTNPANSGTPGSVTASPAPVVLPVPVIQWRGKAISGDNVKNQSVIVGQPVELTTTPTTLPGGFTVSKSTWNVPGEDIKSFIGNRSGITIDDTVDLQDTSTAFYWIYPDNPLNVTYQYCATDPGGNQICTSPQAKATFKATGPTATLSTWDSEEASIEQLDVCTANNKKAPYLGYGYLTGPAPGCPGNQAGTVGIMLIASGASSGKYVFVQIVNADFDTDTYPAPTGGGAAPPPYICGPHAGLDKTYPFPGVYKDTPWIAYDGPESSLPPVYASSTRNFYATMYLLWQPDQLSGTATESIPVPIGYQDWEFIATAYQKVPIGKDTWQTNRAPTASGDEGEGFVLSTPTDNAIYGYPQWSQIVSTDCGVSQSIDPNVLNKYSLRNYMPSNDNGFSKEEQ